MKRFLEQHALNYEFEQLEIIISNYLSKIVKEGLGLTDTFVSSYKEELDWEVERSKGGIKHAMIRFKKDHDSKTYVQLHHEALIDLAGKPLHQVDPAHLWLAPQPAQVFIGHLIVQSVEDLISFLETDFHEHFNLDSRVPAFYVRLATQQIQAGLDMLHHNLQALAPD